MRLTQFLEGDGTIFRDASIWRLKPLQGKAPWTNSSHSLGNQLEWKPYMPGCHRLHDGTSHSLGNQLEWKPL